MGDRWWALQGVATDVPIRRATGGRLEHGSYDYSSRSYCYAQATEMQSQTGGDTRLYTGRGMTTNT